MKASFRIDPRGRGPFWLPRPPRSWPPGPKFVISHFSDGSVASRLEDDSWDLSPYAHRVSSLRIRDTSNPLRQDIEWAFRLIGIWFLFRGRKLLSPETFRSHMNVITPYFYYCHDQALRLDQGGQTEDRLRQLSKRFMPSKYEAAMNVFRIVDAFSKEIGVTLLSSKQIESLARLRPKYKRQQTEYIPSRLFSYQLERAQEVVSDFEKNADAIESCMFEALEIYIKAYGGPREAAASTRPREQHPFYGNESECSYESFEALAQHHGILDLLVKWSESKRLRLGLTSISSFLGRSQFAAVICVANLTGMRISEVYSIREDSFFVREDPEFGQMYFLRGSTSKTAKQSDAEWVTSEACKPAFNVISRISRIRRQIARRMSGQQEQIGEESPRPMFDRAQEPWLATSEKSRRSNPVIHAYSQWKKQFPRLFDRDSLIVRRDDYRESLLVNSTHRSGKLALDQEWQPAWHQIRRTLTVNMHASGLVEDSSLSLLLKHSVLDMTLYYRRGSSSLAVDRSLRSEAMKRFFELLAVRFRGACDERFVSPLGNSHKMRILSVVSDRKHKELVTLAKEGRISYRPTLLGACVYNGHCEFGGADNLVGCTSSKHGSFCPDALVDKRRLPALKRLYGILISRKISSSGHPSSSYDQAQIDGLRRVIEVLESPNASKE